MEFEKNTSKTRK